MLTTTTIKTTVTAEAGDISTATYANVGACRKAAREALGTGHADKSIVRGEHFDMKPLENGRWVWWPLTVQADGTRAGNQERTREDWLREGAHRLLAGVFADALGNVLDPAFRVSCGFPGGGSARTRIGEAWSNTSSADGHAEIFISPVLADSTRVLDVLAHELVHVVVGNEHGHKGPFRTLATAIGLEGKMTATVAGEALEARLQTLVDDMGPYPHAELSLANRKKKKTYLLKVACQDAECGVVFRMTQKHVPENPEQMTCPCCQGPVDLG